MSIFQSVCRVAPTKIFVYICKFVINWQKSKCKAFRRARCGSTYIRRPFGKQTWRLHNSGIYRILTHFCLEKTSTNGSTNWKVIRIGIWWFLQTTRRGSWSWRNIFCVEGTVFFSCSLLCFNQLACEGTWDACLFKQKTYFSMAWINKYNSS